MRRPALLALLFGLVSASAGFGQAVTVKTNAKLISTSQVPNGPPGTPMATLTVYKSEPSGTYNTGTSTNAH